jgi:hypothetical protein
MLLVAWRRIYHEQIREKDIWNILAMSERGDIQGRSRRLDLGNPLLTRMDSRVLKAVI